VYTYQELLNKLNLTFPSHYFLLILRTLNPKCSYTDFKNEYSQFKNTLLEYFSLCVSFWSNITLLKNKWNLFVCPAHLLVSKGFRIGPQNKSRTMWGMSRGCRDTRPIIRLGWCRDRTFWIVEIVAPYPGAAPLEADIEPDPKRAASPHTANIPQPTFAFRRDKQTQDTHTSASQDLQESEAEMAAGQRVASRGWTWTQSRTVPAVAAGLARKA